MLFVLQHVDFYFKNTGLSYFGGFCHVLYTQYCSHICTFICGLVLVTFPVQFLGYHHSSKQFCRKNLHGKCHPTESHTLMIVNQPSFIFCFILLLHCHSISLLLSIIFKWKDAFCEGWGIESQY